MITNEQRNRFEKKNTPNGSLQHEQASYNIKPSMEGPQVLITRSFKNIMVKSAPLNFDQSLCRHNRFLWEENVQDRCSGTLDTSSDSWVAAAQCSKGAKQQKRRSSKNVTYQSKDLNTKRTGHAVQNFYRIKKFIKNSPMGHFLRSFHQ